MSTFTLLHTITKLSTPYNFPHHWLTTRPYLFSTTTIELTQAEITAIQNTINTIEHITTLPAFQAAVLANATTIAQHDPGTPGVLFSYDFHLTPTGPKLIEMNSNAGGILLLALLEEAQGVDSRVRTQGTQLVDMFLTEWQSKYVFEPLNTVAIVDTDPENQFFYPEFLLFQQLLQAHNLQCVIADPSALTMRDNKLWVGDKAIDLIYNRLTDFDFSQPEHAVLRQAYLENQVLVTPHPRAHALYANKYNLTLLANSDFLMACGLDETRALQLQQVVPHAQMVNEQNAEELWRLRKQYFFKPVSGYGGKGVYRGYNITKSVWEDVVAGNYMAQQLVPPSEIVVAGEKRKVDLRAYVYQGKILDLGARLYQGQTTNFRTPGGGFAMVRTPSHH